MRARRLVFGLGRLVGTVGRAMPPLLRDLVGLGGAAAIAYGTWQIYQPAGLIVGGALAIAGAVLHARLGSA